MCTEKEKESVHTFQAEAISTHFITASLEPRKNLIISPKYDGVEEICWGKEEGGSVITAHIKWVGSRIEVTYEGESDA